MKKKFCITVVLICVVMVASACGVAEIVEEATIEPTKEPTEAPSPTVAIESSQSPTQEPTATPEPDPTATPTAAPVLDDNAAVTIEYEEDKSALVEINASQTVSDIKITVLEMSYEQDVIMYSGEAGIIINISYEVENQSEDTEYTVCLDDSILRLSTGETDISAIASDDYYTTYEPGETAQHTMYYLFYVSELKYINSFNLMVIAPYDADGNLMGDDFNFDVALNFPVYEEISRQQLINNLYDYWFTVTAGLDQIGKYTENDFVEESGPITLHIPLAATIEGYIDSQGSGHNYIILPIIVEYSSDEAFYYRAVNTAVMPEGTNGYTNCDEYMSPDMQYYFIGDGFVSGLFSYDVTGADLENAGYIGFAGEAPFRYGEYLDDGFAGILEFE